MVLHEVLNKLFSSPASISILRELSLRNVGITGRELARTVKLTPQAVHNALANLEAFKIVNRAFAGRSHYFTLNRNHYLSRNILESLFESERDFVNGIHNTIKKSIGRDTVSIIIFGSVARGEETMQSDLDLCIVYKNDKKQIEDKVGFLRDKLINEFGVTLAPYFISLDNFVLRAKKNKTPVNNIVLEGKVISGNSIHGLIHG